MTALAEDHYHHKHTYPMPEFEETNPASNQAQSYTPSTDASPKPRTRRRSGGFKTEVASASTGKMGPVDPTEALKEEKLSGSGKPAETLPPQERASREPRAPRPERAPRAPREDREPRADKPERSAPRKERAPRENRPVGNPQPSPETLAAIATVEARLTERRAERDARRAERDKNRPAKAERKPNTPRNNAKKAPAKKSKGGLFAAIGAFFGKLFGKTPEQPKKNGGNRGPRPQGKGGNRNNNSRGGQNRGGQGRRQGGNRGGKGRGQGGEKRHTATSLSNES